MYGYLIDMDGINYCGHGLIPDAEHFFQQLRDDDIPTAREISPPRFSAIRHLRSGAPANWPRWCR
jgi:hypothetical protein